ncbi:FAD binding domain-containing protein [Ectobacillus ponti]|uniref:FAD binding domain-containing protein n=1 Tax=Ectobacillus ponti TaxID=2961894 RepID=A0AA42BRL8_9BACI|nr:FAD binding domain-containing protein [Ectobacillus ponti]MCP8970526.1 FAD binding domain-containing protein [Ectobacillus ponti]
MIPRDFEYYRPNTIGEAAQLFQQLQKEQKGPMYYSGGTEIITGGRLNLTAPGAVIDIKQIPECKVMGWQGDTLVLGAALSLTQISEANLFPLLAQTVSRVADRTSCNKITLGGNIAGHIPYREAVLPCLLADSTFVIAGPGGIRYAPAHEAFQELLRLQPGEFLVQVLTDGVYTRAPFYSVKRRKLEKIDYPLITLTALKWKGFIRIACSGLCLFPFRSIEMERELSDVRLPLEQRIEQALRYIPGRVRNDLRGSEEYRLFVLRNMLYDAVTELEEVRT